MSYLDALAQGYIGEQPEEAPLVGASPQQAGEYNDSFEDALRDGYWGLLVDPEGNDPYQVPQGVVAVSDNIPGATFTLRYQDVGTVLEFLEGCTLTIPQHDTGKVFAEGSIVEVCQVGPDPVTIEGSPGVTILTPGGTMTSGQWASVGLRKREGDEWILSGALA